MDFFESSLYAWIGLPLLVFFARVIDVSLGTLRIIFISRGKKYLAPLLGFVEVFIWIAVVAQIVRGVNDLAAYFAYAAGFAAGNFVGMFIEERLAMGTQVIRIIVPSDADELTTNLSVAGYGVTGVDGQGANGPVKLIYTVVKRKDLPVVLAVIHRTHPHAFLSIEDVRSTQEGIFPVHNNSGGGAAWWRKSK
jgi:uncharacterized protein YebE (UPF0316 family)